MRFPVIGKVLALGVVLLGLLWALGAVSNVVEERRARQAEAQQNVADSLATAQGLLGPVLQRKCTEIWSTQSGEGKERKTVSEQREFTLIATPAKLVVNARAETEPRYRGIFRVNGYTLTATLQAEWLDTAALQPVAAHAPSKLSCAPPVLWAAVSDPRGIGMARIRLQGTELTISPGTPADGAPLGLQASWPYSIPLDGASVKAELSLELIGTESLAFAPVGQANEFHLASDWPHPSFNGRFLPATRDIAATGFQAEWRLSSLASRAAQDLLAGRTLCRPGDALPDATPTPRCIETFGVRLIDPAGSYVLSDRATKYGLLFIALTFVAVALVEVTRRLRVHPLQYLLVGAALAVFFLLLVSLAEHMPFAWAYLAASSACTGLLAFYGVHVLRSLRAGLLFGAGVGLLYAALYVLLLREQTALVLGSVLLFSVLAAVMAITRKLDWYGLVEQMRSEQPRPKSGPVSSA